MNAWSRWVRQPQGLWLRKALFQVHLWVGVALAAYILVICITGSVLVYRNELYARFAPTPLLIAPSASAVRLSEDALTAAAHRAHAGFDVINLCASGKPNEAVEIRLQRGSVRRARFFDPYTG